ncbi:hypothetical protein SDC9_126137 [bioreactor metagenome]|uniref:Uncharacterized protein n=1 Tax=bioreactor metagenome TaxID=1076179 RepID=A0A645CPV1_9ZZZZ
MRDHFLRCGNDRFEIDLEGISFLQVIGICCSRMDLANITDIGIAHIDGSRSARMHPFQVFGSFETDLIAQAHRFEIPIQYPLGMVKIDGFGSHLPILLVGHSCQHTG